jgi:hypothetical protein
MLSFSYVFAVLLNKKWGGGQQLETFKIPLTITSAEKKISFPLPPEGIALDYNSLCSVGFLWVITVCG